MLADLDDNEVIAFTAGTRYLEAWKKAKARGRLSGGFHLFAALFPTLWCAYRRMPKMAIMAYAPLFMAAVIVAVSDRTAAPEVALMMAAGIVVVRFVAFGLLGNGLYLKKTESSIVESRYGNPEEAVRLVGLQSQGGTRIANVVVAVLGFNVASSLLLPVTFAVLGVS